MGQRTSTTAKIVSCEGRASESRQDGWCSLTTAYVDGWTMLSTKRKCSSAVVESVWVCESRLLLDWYMQPYGS